MIFEYIPYEKFVSNAFFLCLLYWIVAFFLYLIRLFDEQGFGKATAYGKLATPANPQNKEKEKEKEKGKESTNFFNKKVIVTKNAWTIFYLTLSVLSAVYLVLLCKIEDNLYNQKILYVLFIIQGLRRCYETVKIQSHRYSEMSLFLFASGISYYVFLASSIYFETLFKEMNGTILEQTNSLEKKNIIKIIISVALFTVNSYEQFQSHKILASLRATDKKDESSTTPQYRIPYGRLFNRCSSPHYFCEILIYLSFLLLTYFNYYTLLLCFVFTFVNLFHRASETHDWYITKFREYPKQRKIMIPNFI
ncbi:hypothetical protein DICPUDRAFT_83663 [Dictyostelium purpureum]|uniref:3-oxo-5-alpha-steroid 4-dehydrogenase C-terminal domain-containing protein n=1 Tax=Dictyostelium purpureum TaxID=5786 RepID=F1A080_DICPU|nr:uncharacterized protein DICPUDRAFT_83663 [Dictyostelium purpureum]EGC30403.1 hypothetical protein DICPUDRAFT_83663 [Dictyostelium purpureum]|eukprot:XP_003293071.1 hypothetical protein DICPUDRAFT_83663 [Dictyostelium purpureum]